MRSRRSVRALAAAVSAAAVGAAACSSSSGAAAGIGYVVDGPVPTYNVSSTAGLSSSAAQAFIRVQTGFSFPGPHGETIADTDFGTMAPVAGDPSSVEYQINPAAVYSDGAPVVCDDMVLAWAAQSGRFTAPGDGGTPQPLFDAPVDPVLSQIAAIDCTPGARQAVVHYSGERADAQWRSAFGATELLPSHIVALGAAGIDPGSQPRRSGDGGEQPAGEQSDGEQAQDPDGGGPAPGGVDIVAAVDDGDTDALRAVADYWNTAFTLRPGAVDPDVFVSSGPYRLDSVDEDGSVELVANDRWWGDAPRTERITVHPRSVSVNTLARDGTLDVLAAGGGAIADLALGSDFTEAVAGSDDIEQLVFASSGDLASPDARRAVAACVPRDALAADVPRPAGDDAPPAVQDSRSTLPGALDYDFLASTAGASPVQSDIGAAQASLTAAGLDALTVRVGYRAPDARRAAVVSRMAEACAPADIRIEDASSAEFTPGELRGGTIDAVLGGTGGAQHGPPRGGGTPTMRLAALTTGAAGNIGGYSSARLDEIVGQLRTTAEGTDAINLRHEAEQILWQDMPTLPLYPTPRTTAFAEGMHAGAPNASWAGAGWNMDRWTVGG